MLLDIRVIKGQIITRKVWYFEVEATAEEVNVIIYSVRMLDMVGHIVERKMHVALHFYVQVQEIWVRKPLHV